MSSVYSRYLTFERNRSSGRGYVFDSEKKGSRKKEKAHKI